MTRSLKKPFYTPLLLLALLMHGVFALPTVLMAGDFQLSLEELLSSNQFVCSVGATANQDGPATEHDCGDCDLCGAALLVVDPAQVTDQPSLSFVPTLLVAAPLHICSSFERHPNDRGPPQA
ncbi:MAG: hypothetical protein RRB13_06745 [bacterium]|nr:hypothetical protein [bacterium]